MAKNNNLTILYLHGVADMPDRCEIRNSGNIHMPVKRFRKLLELFENKGPALSMDQVVQHCHEGRPFAPNSFAVTFDDGFENNNSIASHILADLKVPATFYITTDFIDNNSMSWTDRIEYYLEYGHFEGWNVHRKKSYIKNMRMEAKTNRKFDREGAVETTREQSGMPEVVQTGCVLDQKMSWAQVKQLSDCSLFTIGAHTMSHMPLHLLGDVEMETEINGSIGRIKEKTGREVLHFCYPYGQHYTYTDKTIILLKSAGIRSAVTAAYGPVSHNADLYNLSRVSGGWLG